MASHHRVRRVQDSHQPLSNSLHTSPRTIPSHFPLNDKSPSMETPPRVYRDFIALTAFDHCDPPSGCSSPAFQHNDAGFHDHLINAESCESSLETSSSDSVSGYQAGEHEQLEQLNLGTGIQVIQLFDVQGSLLEKNIYRDCLENSDDHLANENTPDIQAKMDCDLSRAEICDGNSSMLGLNKKSRVWCSTSENKWTFGTIYSVTDTDAYINIDDKQNPGELLKLPHTKLLPANPDILEGVIDLIQLSYLNEPSVLHNLRCRYGDDRIYTRAGPILVAINPFKAVPLYGKEYLEAYSCKSKENNEPHVYSTMASAFKAVIEDGVNQSVIISGESGAGKTETAKIAMQYLTAVGGAGDLVNQLLQTNPILEAFGNAKTMRNNNSSRFGKLIDIYFDDLGKICGASIQTYLLEKSRVVLQANNERSYHIFYQLCAGADTALKDAIHLRSANDYFYLNQSHCLRIENVDDAHRFQEVLFAMDDMKITKHEQHTVFSLLSAVLWIGNIKFSIIDDENHVHVIDDEAVQYTSELLECTKQHLMTALSSWTIHAGGEVIRQKLTYSKAIDSRDALAKAIYSAIFDWLVDRINRLFEIPNCPRKRCISILDIYGFESFLKNSFEQLCINYANERLQQHFNRHLFKLEQEEYTSEGIDWTHIEFDDNQQCLDLFEKWPVGLISLLDEECTFPKASDDTFLDKLKLHLNCNVCFKSERMKSFSIKHYAGEVTYNTVGFLEKNKDVLHMDLLQLLASCRIGLPQIIATTTEYGLQKSTTSQRRTGAELQKQSIATKFKSQLHKLMQRLDDTEPHFIRCIKPNTSQQSGFFQDELVLQQLRCCGVLEVVRISRAGYPTRILHEKFASRYGFLIIRAKASHDEILNLCIEILQQFSVPPEMYRIGCTKLFFRAGQIGRLEDFRQKTINGIICFQKLYKGYKARCYYKAYKRAIYVLQALVRGRKARKLYESRLKEHRAAIILQSFIRGRAKRKEFLRTRNMILIMQLAIRHWLARKQLTRGARHKTSAHMLEESRGAGHATSTHMLEESRDILSAANEISLKTQQERAACPDPEGIDLKVMLSGRMQSADTTVRVPRTCLAELESRVLSAEAALQEKEIENAILQKNLNRYESLWSDYVSEILSLEAMWQMQMTSLQLSINAAKQSLTLQGPSCKELQLDGKQPFKNNPNQQFRATRHILPHDENDKDDEFDWDEATSAESTTPDHGSTPRKQSLQTVGDLPARSENSTLRKLTEEFEHRRQVFEDDAQFLIEVKSGQAEATLDPNEELRNLKQRFNMWKKDFKYRLRETKCILQKLGEGESAQKLKRIWWSKRRVQKAEHGGGHHHQQQQHQHQRNR